MGTGGRASEPLLCVHRARGRDMRQVCVRRHGSARTHRHAAVGPGRVLPCTGSEGPRGPHRPRRESRTARQRPRACGVSALFAQTVEGAGEAGRARRRGAGGRGARCGCAARRRARQVCKEMTSKKEFRFSTLCTGMLGAGSRQREESDVTPRGESSARAKGKGRVGAVATRPMGTMRQGMDGAAGE